MPDRHPISASRFNARIFDRVYVRPYVFAHTAFGDSGDSFACRANSTAAMAQSGNTAIDLAGYTAILREIVWRYLLSQIKAWLGAQ
jgi:hypothetical protein